MDKGRTLVSVIVAIFIILGILFVAQVLNYYRKIKSGNIADLSQFRSQFTALSNATAAEGAALARRGELETADDPSLGNTNAPLTIVEFGDFECPFCKRAYPIVRELAAKYPDTIRVIYRDFPITALHTGAQRAAEAGACAHEQGKFWAYHDRLFDRAPAFSTEELVRYALQIGLDETAFRSCLTSRKYEKEVASDYAAGIAAGVVGTPTWFVNGTKIEGMVPLQVWEGIINKLTRNN